MTFTELEAMEKVATEIYNRGFEDGKKAEYNDFKFSETNETSVLDKIRAEIIELPTISINANDVYKADVLQIIDKYKAEREDKG